MIENILNLEGVTVLNKKQQGSISGGRQVCYLSLGNGGTVLLILKNRGAKDRGASDDANAACVNEILKHNAGSCSYDCEHDGIGQ